MKIKEKKSVLIIAGLFAFVFGFHVILNLTVQNPWAMGDEIGVLATAARFSGYDWRNALQSPSNYGSGVNYYGGGFGILLTPLFILIKNRPYVLYQAILLVCALLQSVPVIFSYRILNKYLKLENKMLCACASVAACFFVASRATTAVNESMLSFCMWLSVYLVVVLYNEKNPKKVAGYSLLLSFVLSYSYTVHSRALVMIFVFCISIVLSRVIVKNKIVDLRFFVPGLLFFLCLANRFNDFIIQEVFVVTNGKINNTGASGAVSVISQMKGLFKGGNIRAFLDVIVSNWLSIGLVSAFTFSVCVFLFVIRFFKLIKKRVKKQSIESQEGLVVTLGFLVFGCTVGTLLLFGFNWLETSIIALENSEATRGYSYLRYMGAYYGAFITLLSYEVWKVRDNFKQNLAAWIISVATYILSFFYMYFSVLKRLPNPDGQLDYFHFFAPFNLSVFNESANGEKIIVSLLVGGIIAIFLYLLIYIKKYKTWALLFCIVIVYQYAYISLAFDGKYAHNLYESISSMTQLMNSNKDVKKEIESLYFPLISGHWEVPYLAQYYFPETDIIKEFPKEKDSIMIVYRQLEEKELNGKKFKHTIMPDNSYVYVSGDKYIELFESVGIKFVE